MFKKLLVVLALASAALAFIPADQAEARRGGGGGGGGFRSGGGGGGSFRAGGFRAAPIARGPSFAARPFVGRPSVRYYRRGYVAPLIVTGGGCLWLRQRAQVTGSSYWWRRYNACRYGY